MNKARILLVDDEPIVLQSIQRVLRKRFTIDTAATAGEALELLDKHSYAVAVSDYRMPGMNGIEFLAVVKERSTDTVRLMLTGQADMEATVRAVNEGNIFRFLTKPCPHDALAQALDEAVKQYRLITAEKELLEKTLNGSVTLLVDLLSLVNPKVFGRASRLRSYVRQISQKLGLKKGWLYELAAMMSQIGSVTVPQDILEKAGLGLELTEAERILYENQTQVSHRLLSHIPRMESVAEIINRSSSHILEISSPDFTDASSVEIGTQILKAVTVFDQELSRGESPRNALLVLEESADFYHPKLMAILGNIPVSADQMQKSEVKIAELTSDMIFATDVSSLDGVLLVAKGQEVTSLIKEKLASYSHRKGIKEPIKVLIRRLKI